MNPNRARSIAALLSVSFLGVPWAVALPTSQEPRPLPARLCEVVAQPEKFHHQILRIDASVISDGLHGTYLVSAECKKGIALSLEPEARESDAGRRMGEVLAQGRPGSLGKD